MEIGLIGLGRMGGNMAQRLVRAGHRVVVYDLNPAAIEEAAGAGAEGAATLNDMAAKLKAPRAVWLMVPAGVPVQRLLDSLSGVLAAGDMLIDGGNSYYKDSVRRAAALSDKGLHFVDVGVSGGTWGLEEGYGLMIGGPQAAVQRLTSIFQALAPAPDKGWGYVGPAGAGHFAKMVHNGIEYGMMEAYAEGFALLSAKADFKFDLHQLASIWRHGTVIRSWLLDLTEMALAKDVSLTGIAPWVDDSGEGRWTVSEAVDLAVPVPVIAESLFARFRSRRPEDFGSKLLAALRHGFGGHPIKDA